MHGESTLSFGIHHTGRNERERYILEVVSFAGIHLHEFGNDLAAGETDNTSFLQQRHTVNHDTCALGVRTLCQLERKRNGIITGSVAHFTFVREAESEDSRLIYRHIAALVNVDIEFRILEF